MTKTLDITRDVFQPTKSAGVLTAKQQLREIARRLRELELKREAERKAKLPA